MKPIDIHWTKIIIFSQDINSLNCSILSGCWFNFILLSIVNDNFNLFCCIILGFRSLFIHTCIIALSTGLSAQTIVLTNNRRTQSLDGPNRTLIRSILTLIVAHVTRDWTVNRNWDEIEGVLEVAETVRAPVLTLVYVCIATVTVDLVFTYVASVSS